MATMQLSSLRRLRLYCGGEGEAPVSDALKNNRVLSMWLSSVSDRIETYLCRKILIDSYTQFFDAEHSKIEYFIDACPIISLMDVYEEPRALWFGYEREIQYSTLGSTKNSIVLPFGLTYVQRRALRARYYGGLALSATNSDYTISSITGTFVAGKYIRGNTSGAVGIVNAIASSLLTIETYYGEFKSGEIVSQYDSEPSAIGSPSVYATINKPLHFGFTSYSGLWELNKWVKGDLSETICKITTLSGTPYSSMWLTLVSGNGIIDGETVNLYDDAACTTLTETAGSTTVGTTANLWYVNHKSLLESHPAIVQACEMQVRYMRRHMEDFEVVTSDRNGMTRRRESNVYNEVLIPEVQAMLQPYVIQWGF